MLQFIILLTIWPIGQALRQPTVGDLYPPPKENLPSEFTGTRMEALSAASGVIAERHKGLDPKWNHVRNYYVQFLPDTATDYVFEFLPIFKGRLMHTDFANDTGWPLKIYVRCADLRAEGVEVEGPDLGPWGTPVLGPGRPGSGGRSR
jgi:hypothetical protein